MTVIKPLDIKYAFFTTFSVLIVIATYFITVHYGTISWNKEMIALVKKAAFLGPLLWLVTIRLSFFKAVSLFVVAICIVTGFTAAILGVVVFWGICWGLGYSVITLLKPKIKATQSGINPSNILVSETLVTGYIVMSLLLTALAYTPYNTSLHYFFIFLTPVAYGLSRSYKEKALLQSPVSSLIDDPLSKKLLLLPLCFTLSLLLLFALLPDLGSDSIAAYRSIIMELMHQGRFNYDPETSSIRLLTLSGLWPQSFAAIISGEYVSAKLLNFSILILACVVAFDLSEDKRSMALSLAALLSIPMMADLTNSAFYDNNVFFLMTGALFFIVKLSEAYGKSETSSLPISRQALYYNLVLGGLLGLLILTKYTTLYIAPMIALLVMVSLIHKTSLKSNIANSVKASLIIATVITVIWGTFLLFVYQQSGNPLFPYYNDVFKSDYFAHAPKYSPHKGYTSFHLLWDITFKTTTYSGTADVRNGALGLIALLWTFSSLFFLLFYKRLKNTVSRLPLICLIAFIAGLVLISALQNSPRYLVILFPFLLLPMTLQFKTMGNTLAGVFVISFMAMHMFLLPHMGWAIISADGIFKRNHPNIIEAYRPLRTVSDELSDRYGVSGNALFLHGGDAGFIGRSYIDNWYDDRTDIRLAALDYASPEAVKTFLQARKIDAVIVSKSWFLKLKKESNTQILKTFTDLSETTKTTGGIRVYHMTPETAFPAPIIIPEDTFLKAHTIFNANNISDVKFEFDYRCEKVNAFRFITVKPSGEWAHYQSFIPNCDGEQNKFELSKRNLNPNRRYILTTAPAQGSEFEIISGKIYKR